MRTWPVEILALGGRRRFFVLGPLCRAVNADVLRLLSAEHVVKIVDHGAFWLLRQAAQRNVPLETAVADQRGSSHTKRMAIRQLNIDRYEHAERWIDSRLLELDVKLHGAAGAVGERVIEFIFRQSRSVDVFVEKPIHLSIAGHVE